MREIRARGIAAAAITAAIAFGAAGAQPRSLPAAFQVRPAPRAKPINARYLHAMVTSTDAEIAEHNRNVNTRQVRRHRERMARK